ncbi:eCIS core domain-containing protein [Nannocystis pusilla]|uniref:eCIS core domain-containing protein n=1 Tax=Nannocystis pusilla TaxID=889268 RepID=UPI003DA1D112
MPVNPAYGWIFHAKPQTPEPQRLTPSVSERDDPSEREADRIAERITASDRIAPVNVSPHRELQLRRACACGGTSEEEATLRRAPRDAAGPASPGLSRDGEGLRLTAEAASQLNSLRRSPGQELPANERTFFEPRLGHDLSRVRIHQGSPAAAMASRINARAFTIGNDIFFARGEFRPGGREGRRLLAHELVHTVQDASSTAPRISRAPAAAVEKTVPSTLTFEVPMDLLMATWTGTLGQVEGLTDRIVALNYDQALKLYHNVVYYLKLYKTGEEMLVDQKTRGRKYRGRKFDERQRRDIYNAVHSYEKVRDILENMVGKIEKHRAYTRPPLTANVAPDAGGSTSLEATVSEVYKLLAPEERRFFAHLYDIVRLDLDYLLSGEKIPPLLVSERRYYGYLPFEAFNDFVLPPYAPIGLSDLAPKFADPAASIASYFQLAAEGSETPQGIARRIAGEYDSMDKAFAKMRQAGGGACEQGSADADATRMCTMIRLVLCMAGDNAYLYSALPDPTPDESCAGMLKK